MNYEKIEDVKILRRFSKQFDEDHYLLKYEATSEDGEAEMYLLLKVVGKIHIDEKLAQSLATRTNQDE